MTAYKSLGYEIAITHKFLKAGLQRVLNPYDVTVQQFEVLRTLMIYEGVTAVKLVDYVISDSSTIMALLKRLEDKGLIIRTSDEKDRRTKLISLTGQGRLLIGELMQAAERFNSGIQDCCSAEEFEVVRKVLKRLSSKHNMER
jgi:DNA-binding MarR family transcriptional regulator